MSTESLIATLQDLIQDIESGDVECVLLGYRKNIGTFYASATVLSYTDRLSGIGLAEQLRRESWEAFKIPSIKEHS